MVVLRDGRAADEVLELERMTSTSCARAPATRASPTWPRSRIGVLEPDGKFSFIRVKDAGEPPPAPEKHQA